MHDRNPIMQVAIAAALLGSAAQPVYSQFYTDTSCSSFSQQALSLLAEDGDPIFSTSCSTAEPSQICGVQSSAGTDTSSTESPPLPP